MKQLKSLKKASGGLMGALAIAGGTHSYANPVNVAPPADFTPTGETTSPSFRFNWDVDSNGTADFRFTFNQVSLNGNNFFGIYPYGGMPTAGVIGYIANTIGYASRLSIGENVGLGRDFISDGNYFLNLASRFNGTNYGQFQPPDTRGFVGFQFTAADGLHYGYLELSVQKYNSAADPGGFRFFGAAYETTPNASIAIVPEPGTIAMLAFGAAGLAAARALRRQRRRS